MYEGAFERTADPAETPFSVDEAKSWVRQLLSVDDSDITMLIKAVTADYESKTGEALVEAEYTWKLDCLPKGGILRPPMAPLVSVTSFSYVDQDGATQAFANSNFTVDTTSMPGRIALAYEKDWPDYRTGIINPITIVFRAGYNGAANVPKDAQPALRLLLAHWYKNREAVLVGTIGQELPLTTREIINARRLDY